MTTTPIPRTDIVIDAETIAAYRRDGMVRVPALLTAEEAREFRSATLRAAEQSDRLYSRESVFDQRVNVWRDDPDMRRLTLHPRVASAASQLSGARLRLWHDQILIKRPHNAAATEFHQDQPYWPHAQSPAPISCWIALCDVPVERGCMTFLPRQQHRTDLTPQNLTSATSLFDMAPDLRWVPRVTIPLRAGDCTFHHGRCPHMATPNHTDEPRVAHVVIFIDAATRYTGTPHVVTDPLGLEPGAVLEGDMFPLV